MQGWKCGFTLDHYREMLEFALDASVRFLGLRDMRAGVPEGRVILMRHDIDFSVIDALHMARLEESFGIHTTYSVLLHSPLYNVGELQTRMMLREIVSLGHEMALHWDLGFFRECDIDPRKGLEAEVRYLETVVGTQICSISQHKPWTYGVYTSFGDADYVDAYTHPSLRGMLYVSDSGRKWRDRCVHGYLAVENRLHVLIHPEWWSRDGRHSRRSVIDHLTQVRQREIESNMLEYADSVERYLREREARNQLP